MGKLWLQLSLGLWVLAAEMGWWPGTTCRLLSVLMDACGCIMSTAME